VLAWSTLLSGLRRNGTPESDCFSDDRRDEAIDTYTFALRLSGELGIERPGEALASLSGFDPRRRPLSARLPEYIEAILQRFPPVGDGLLDCLAVGHASGDIGVLDQVPAALFGR